MKRKTRTDIITTYFCLQNSNQRLLKLETKLKKKQNGLPLSNRFLGSLLVVLGEFDLTGHSEPNTPTEKNVKRVVVHRDYVERTFENDLAILELETAVEFKPYIVPVCLPSTSEGDFVGRKAEVTGWGKLSHSESSFYFMHSFNTFLCSIVVFFNNNI